MKRTVCRSVRPNAIARTGDTAGACAVAPSLQSHRVPRPTLLTVTLWLLGSAWLTAQDPRPDLLTKCAEVRALTPDQAARGLPVRVRGVVTLLPGNATDSFTLDDGTGIWVATTPPTPQANEVARLRVGDLVEVDGQTHAGHFAPTIAARSLHVLGQAPLRAASPITQLSLTSGVYDCQRVQLTGVVQAAESAGRGGRTELKLLISTPTGNLTYLLYGVSPEPISSLVDSEVSVSGVFLSFFNSRREFLGARINSNQAADLQILRQPPADAFAVPEVALGDVMGFSARGIDLHRRRVRGTVTLCKPGHYFYLEEHPRALRINTRQPDVLQPGDVVEATGFLQLEHHRAEMNEAAFRRIGRQAAPTPAEITRQQAFDPEPRSLDSPLRDYDDRLVALRGRLVSFDHKHGEPLRLNLECDGVLVPAEFSGPHADSFVASLRPDSELRVSGICVLTFSQSRPVVEWPTPVSLRLLVRGPADIQVIRASSWWTPERLWAALGLTAVVLLIALAWVALLRRRVAQRSTQLAEEMSARRDAAVEFESTLRERNRLAVDLHDTTEQSLTGLAFQLEATGALQTRAPERSQHHLALARQLLSRSREDLRRSIWNLRATSLEKNTLSEALLEVAADRSAGLSVEITVATEGAQHALTDLVAGNLLLLAQEGITNALKHAQPARIELRLVFSEGTVTLVVRDDGVGFDPSTAEGPKEGHFGLQGMRERMKRLGGRIEIKSAPGRGTLLTATVPH